MTLNNNIKRLREEKKITQQQLADKLYVSRQKVCRLENGSRCPELITAKKLALELYVSMDEFREDAEETTFARVSKQAIDYSKFMDLKN